MLLDRSKPSFSSCSHGDGISGGEKGRIKKGFGLSRRLFAFRIENFEGFRRSNTVWVAEGTSIITEGVWDNRFKYVDELNRLGAKITVDGKVAVIEGVKELTGAPVRATDLRGGAAMIIAGLIARGTTQIEEIIHIERGYEDVVEKNRPGRGYAAGHHPGWGAFQSPVNRMYKHGRLVKSRAAFLRTLIFGDSKGGDSDGGKEHRRPPF